VTLSPEAGLSLVAGTAMLGSLHCGGMCGGFVLACAPRRGLWRYQVGRLTTYLALGALAGALGAGLGLVSTDLLGFQRAAGLVLGGVLIALAVRTLWPAGVSKHTPGSPVSRFSRLRQALWARIVPRPVPGERPKPMGFAVGLLSGLLPCGWLWSFVVLAAAAGSPLRGLGVMAAFFAGTAPLLMLFGLLAGRLAFAGALQRHAPRLTAALMLAAGLLAVAGKLGPTFEAGLSPDGRVTEICNHP
jgi:sulfite exporter TauE/SafE